MHWLPFAFAASIFLFHIQYWFVLYDYDVELISRWTWATYAPFLALAVILFLSGGLVLPSASTRPGNSLIEDFQENGKISLLFLAAYILAWVPFNAWGAGTWLTSGVWYNLGLLVPLLVAYFAQNSWVRDVSALLFLLAQIYGLLFVWSNPTDLI